MSGRKTIEERIAERQAALPALEEGAVFEHGPAKFIFMAIIGTVFVAHLVALVLMMTLGMH